MNSDLTPLQHDTDNLEPGEEWSLRLRRRRRVRAFVAWLYLSSVTLTILIHSMRRWDGEQLEWLAQWGGLFMTPALCVWVWQAMRRRFAIEDSGELLARFPPQRVGPLPRWLPATAYLVVSSAPFLMLLFQEAHLLMMVAIAFAGVIMFALAWLRYDGIPVECRRIALVIDGVHVVTWDRIHDATLMRRTNVVQLLLWPRRKRLSADSEQELHSLAADANHDFESSETRSHQRLIPGRHTLQRRARRGPFARDIFVCAEERATFLDCVERCREAAATTSPQHDDVA